MLFPDPHGIVITSVYCLREGTEEETQHVVWRQRLNYVQIL